MILPYASVGDGEVPKLFTYVYWKDRYILVGMSEEELFRKVLGDEVFEQRADAEYYKQEGSDHQ